MPESKMTPQEAIKMLRETLGAINSEMENIIHPPGCEGGNWGCPFCAIVGRSTEALYATEQVDDGLVLPEGWVTVPRKYTQSMYEAGDTAFENGYVEEMYTAMINAAPPLPK